MEDTSGTAALDAVYEESVVEATEEDAVDVALYESEAGAAADGAEGGKGPELDPNAPLDSDIDDPAMQEKPDDQDQGYTGS